MPSQRVNNIDMYYEITGQGEPVILIHGLGSSTRDWSEQVTELAKGYQVITVDLRGHGLSSRRGPFSVVQFANDINTLLENLNIPSAHVIGISLGSAIAFQLALDAPSRVRSLGIVNGGPIGLGKTLPHRKMVWSRLLQTRFLGMRRFGKNLAEKLFPHPQQEPLRQLLTERWAKNHGTSYRRSLVTLVGWNVYEKISTIKCPCLVVTGDRDYTPVAFKQAYIKQLANARLVVISDSGHFTPFDQPDALNRALQEFLGSISPALQKAV